MISKSRGSLKPSKGNVTSGHDGTGHLGCFCCNKLQVSGVLGAIPEEERTLHAIPSNPSLALETAD